MIKGLLVLCAAYLVSAFGQGQVRFQTYLPGQVDAPVRLQRFYHGPGPDFSAQLVIDQGTTVTPLSPTTTFNEAGVGEDATADRYVVPVDIILPEGYPAGITVVLKMRVWKTSWGSYEQAIVMGPCDYGESNPIAVTLTDGDLPPAPLTGLFGFTLGALSGCGPLPPINKISVERGKVQIVATIFNFRNTLLEGTSDFQVWIDLGGPSETFSSSLGAEFVTAIFNSDIDAPYKYYRLVEP